MTRSRHGLNLKRRILVVDDRRDARYLTKCLLESLGHDVTVAATGVEALARIGEAEPDVVFCDVVMPDMDGFEVARRIRADFPRITLVAVTGDGHEQFRRQAQAAGFDEFLVKPAGVDVFEGLLAGEARDVSS